MLCLIWPTWMMQFWNYWPEDTLPQDVKFITISYVFSCLFSDIECYYGKILTLETCLQFNYVRLSSFFFHEHHEQQFWAVRLPSKSQVVREVRTLIEWVVPIEYELWLVSCYFFVFGWTVTFVCITLLKQLIIDLCLLGACFSDGLCSSEALLIYASWHSLIILKERHIPIKWYIQHQVSLTCLFILFFFLVWQEDWDIHF